MYPNLFYINDTGIPSYYVMNIIGIIAGFIVLYFSLRGAEKQKIRSTLFFAAAIFVPFIIGGRLGFEIEQYMDKDVLFADGKIIFGPTSLWWGLVLATLSAFPIAAVLKTNVWETADFFAPSIAIGGVFARVACLLNGCCIGTPAPANAPGVFYPYGSYAYTIFGDVPLHPATLYESLAWLLIFILLMLRKKTPYFKGELIAIMAFLYSIARFGIEFIRYHELPEFPSYAQMFCLLIFACSIITYIIRKLYFSKQK